MKVISGLNVVSSFLPQNLYLKLRFVHWKKISSEKKERENRDSHFYNDTFKHENPAKETIIFPKPTTADYMSKF